MFLELHASLTFTYLSHLSCFLNHQLLTIFTEALMVKQIKPNGDACISRTLIIIVLEDENSCSDPWFNAQIKPVGWVA